MAQHPNVQTIDRMTQAALNGDTDRCVDLVRGSTG
jgi:hypothetical protein